MEKYYDILKSSALLKGIAEAELKELLSCVGAEARAVRKGGVFLLAGDTPRHIGVAAEGLLHIVREDRAGNRSIVAAVTPGEVFAEAMCCAGVTESPVTVEAAADSVVIMLPFPRILRTCQSSCAYHNRLIENITALIADKNLRLQSRMEIISQKSVRAKVMLYLESCARAQGKTVTVPFNREKLADFLCVERTALSHELARMKQDGILDYKKNVFALK